MLMRFDPFGDFDRLGQDLRRGGRPSGMPVDAFRAGDRFHLNFDLPGVDPQSIDITVERNTVTVTAERSWDPEEGAQILIRERPAGSFTRSFILGDGLDADRIEADYDHGVLTLTIPVAEQAKPRKLVVGAGDKALTG